MNKIISTRRNGVVRPLIEAISLALCKLAQIQFDAPWRARRQRC